MIKRKGTKKLTRVKFILETRTDHYHQIPQVVAAQGLKKTHRKCPEIAEKL